MFVPLVSILQYFVGRPVNKLVLVASRCQSDPYMEEIILLRAIRLSELSNLSVTHLIKLCLLQKFNKSEIKWDKVSINLNDHARDTRHLKMYAFLVRHSLYNSNSYSQWTRTDSYRFFVTVTRLVKFI